MGNLESTVKVVQGGNGGIETRTSILSLYRNRILFACRISHRLATRISNGIERRIHKETPCTRQHTQRYPSECPRLQGAPIQTEFNYKEVTGDAEKTWKPISMLI